eukprot:scaffold641_cov237-Pinguiococcus_pyrenoidosus.AAC.14
MSGALKVFRLVLLCNARRSAFSSYLYRYCMKDLHGMCESAAVDGLRMACEWLLSMAAHASLINSPAYSSSVGAAKPSLDRYLHRTCSTSSGGVSSAKPRTCRTSSTKCSRVRISFVMSLSNGRISVSASAPVMSIALTSTS